MTCKCQCGEYPIGPSRAEAIRVAVEANSARWVAVMEETLADIRRRESGCCDLKANAIHDRDAERLHAKVESYGHAAEMLHDAIARAKGTP